VALLQQLSYPDLPVLADVLPAIALKSLRVGDWVRLEHLLRDYAQFHLGRTFRAATLVDSLTVLDF
jgi:DNA repair protein RecO (recombination protein O)